MSYSQLPHRRNISPYKLVNRELIGEGAFGRVYKATWLARCKNGREFEEIVAIKVMKNATRGEAFNERDRMAGLNHENVVRLVGVVQQGDPCPLLVMEYAENGDLFSYIQSRRDYGGIDADTMIRIAWHVAKGMRYLHEKEIIHGDLAARNILLDENDVAKIGDLGYFDGANSESYYDYLAGGVPCPIRWMPPENLPFRKSRYGLTDCNAKHSRDGDVWAFGTVLFELWSKGELPFKDYNNFQVCELLLDGKKPTHFFSVQMRAHMRNLMHSCWQFDPNNRPGFCRIVHHFEEKAGFEPED